MMFKISKITQALLLIYGVSASNAYATNTSEFNIDILDAEDIENVDMSQFSVAGYVIPGDYVLSVFVNGQRLGSPRDINVFVPTSGSDQNQITCIPVDLIDLLGLKESSKKEVTTFHDGKCLDLSALAGVTTKIELSNLSLNITIPQSWMEYRDPYWIPPELWEEGVNGAFIDYNLNANYTENNNGSKRSYLSSSGTSGINVGSWRLRGDYYATYQTENANNERASQTKHDFDFSRLYAFKSIKSLSSLFTLGENYFYSDIFESWQYTGMSLESDDRMLPPKLVGYAPEIIGVANTNATVIVRSQDRIILETTVPAGPFRIQTLDSGIRGVLDVTVKEEDGEEKKFSITTASLPYLTRPGRIDYKLVSGKTRYDNHKHTGKPVAGGEFSYGISNAWSLYGGSQLSGDYQTVAAGIGRDLFVLGAVSFDMTQSIAHLKQDNLQGRSYRLNYSKSFEEVRTDITFAGYRFADKNYRTLSQFMDENRTGTITNIPKENYQVYINKYFDNFNLSLNYQHSTYWRDKPQTQYGLYASTNISMPWLSQQNANISVSATRTERNYNGSQDDSVNLYLSIPFYEKHTLNFSEIYSRSGGSNRYNHSVGFSGYNDTDSYNVNVGYTNGQNVDSQSSVSGYYTRSLSQANISANASYVPQQYRSIGASINSGITATGYGVALHRSAYGDTRLMITTDGVSDVPLDNGITKTNYFGVAVIPNINSYRRSTISINTSKLPDNIETLDSTTDITLTKGAIGHRVLTVMKGEKIFAVLSLADGKTPPFGASVRNKDNRELGIVGEDGVTWLVGVSPEEKLSVFWGGEPQCELHLPNELKANSDMILLPCSLAIKTESLAKVN